MTEQENKHKKVPVTTYHLGEKGYFMLSPTINGYHCWGYIGKTHIDVEAKEQNEIPREIIKQITKAKIDYTKDLMICEEIALRIKENGLEKTAKALGSIKEKK